MNSLHILNDYVESEEFLKSPRYEQYSEHALSVAHKKVKIFNDSPFKHDDGFKERVDQIFYNIVAIELMQFEYKEQNAYFNAEWDHFFTVDNPLPDIDYLYRLIDEQIENLCRWGEYHAYG